MSSNLDLPFKIQIKCACRPSLWAPIISEQSANSTLIWLMRGKAFCKITVKCLEVQGKTVNVFKKKKRQASRFSFLKMINGCKIKLFYNQRGEAEGKASALCCICLRITPLNTLPPLILGCYIKCTPSVNDFRFSIWQIKGAICRHVPNTEELHFTPAPLATCSEL